MTWICHNCQTSNMYWRNSCTECGTKVAGFEVNSDQPDPGESAYEHARRIRRPTALGV